MSRDPVCIDDFEKHAERFLPKMYWKYYSGGSDAHISLKECKNAFKRYRNLRKQIIKLSSCHAEIQSRSKLDNWGADIHILVFIHHKNNRFQKKLIVQNTATALKFNVFEK